MSMTLLDADTIPSVTTSRQTLYHVVADTIPATSITDKCIVLDLDQTLIATQDKDSMDLLSGIISNPKLLSLRKRVYHFTIEDYETPGIGTKYDFWGVTRPHINDFLIFCFSYFKVVAIWSAGKRPYVEAIVDYLFKDLPQPHVVFTHDDVEVDSQGTTVIKPLTKMIESNPVLRRNMSLQNTLALDDNYMTFVLNEQNGVLIPAYEPTRSIDALSRDDPTLLQFKNWLLIYEVVNSRDVTKLDKSKIFKTPLNVYQSKLKSIPGYRFS